MTGVTLAAPTIPLELRRLPQWVLWRWETRHGKVTKPPYQPNGTRASTRDSATWNTFETVLDAFERGGYDGIGFVLTDKDPYVVADLDHCLIDGRLTTQAAAIVKTLNSYSEVTPSGTGVRVIAKGNLPPGRRKRGDVEVYEKLRYITVTGHHLKGTPFTIEERSAEAARVHAEVFSPKPVTPSVPQPNGKVGTSDEDILRRARAAKNRAVFAALWDGRIDGHPSRSEADLALCAHLAYWTSGDAGRMDHLFRQSGLMRPKWDDRHSGDGRTYGQVTIKKALSAANLTSDGAFPNIGGEVTGLPRVNAADLQKEALRPDRPGLKFLPLLGHDGFIVQGFSHLLARLAWGWSNSGHLVLYVTEEPRLVWEERLAHFSQGGEGVSLVFALGSPPNDLLHTIEGGEERVIIVDTQRLLGLSDENDNSEINRVFTPLIALCRQGAKTLIVTHHTRKGGGEFGTAAAGGHALAGVVDIVLEVLRDPQATNRRKVRGWGRIVAVPELLYELLGSELVALGDPQEVGLDEVKTQLRDALTNEWQKTKELRDALAEPRSSDDQVVKALSALARSGEMLRDPPMERGPKRGTTYRWRLNLTSDYKGEVIGGEVSATKGWEREL